MNESGKRKIQIVDTAMKLFRKRGVDQVTVQDICNEMEITRSSFYYHFNSKEDVLDYYFLSTEIEIVEHLLPLLAKDSSYGQFISIFQLYMARTVEWGPSIFAQIIKRFVDGKNQLLSPDTIAMKEVYLSLITQAQRDEEILNHQSAEVIVEHIVYLSVGLANRWCNQSGGFVYSDKLEDLIKQYLQPIKA